MTVEQESSPDQMEAPSSGEDSARWSRLAAIARWTPRVLARWRLILAAALVTAAIGVPAGLFFVLYRPDRQIDDAAAHQAIKAASDGAVAVLSYSPADFDRDFANAKSHLTGDFLTYYDKFAGQFVKPMAQQKQITASAKVIRAAASELHPDSAVVLVFIDQNTASKEKPEPLITKSSVVVTLTKVNGSWLIAKFDPVG
ncbi:hypothetical protein [Mycobacterium kyorinense]|uniref:Twin-arginine translocation pathway signal n=1 Tax=Mycobacterium kyorinense TaxID=487514 RepID=A0A1X1Y2V8_9MYCO|nr:hypothetical protein [Mycobacterium kyorinense]ORW05462.1 hypothetical protein AWC14_27270 [Mycobacterium kyorinense]